MRVVLQRVRSAAVRVEGEVVGEIGPGLLLLVGVESADGEDAEVTTAGMEWLASKLLRLRIFSDAQGIMNHSLEEAGGNLLAVSQFTLFASTRKGNRPSWSRAAPPEVARPLFERFVALLESRLGRPVARGVFGADMQVELVNDGPVTLLLDSRSPE